MELLDWVWNSPHSVLWVAPVLFAVAVLFDNDFIGSGVYCCRMDGVVVSALFGGLVPLIALAPFIEYEQLLLIPYNVFLTAILGSLLYAAHLYFYFDVLFTLDTDGIPVNDGAGVELFINLNVLFVPLCAWVLMGQSLSLTQWCGVMVILISALLMSGIRCVRSTVRSGIMTALVLAAYYLCEDFIYDFISLKNGFFVFSVCMTVIGVGLLANPVCRPARSVMARKNLLPFLLAEITTILAVLASQQALHLNPVVYVIAIESFTPVFVAILSLVPTACIAVLMKRKGAGTQSLRPRLLTFSAQREHFLMKSYSTILMIGGTVLLLS